MCLGPYLLQIYEQGQLSRERMTHSPHLCFSHSQAQAPATYSDLEIPPRAARSFRHHDAFLGAYILDLAVWYAQAGLRGASANFGSISKLRYERVIFHVIDSFFGALAFQGHCVSRNCEHARSVLGVSVAGHPATLLSMH